MYVYVYLYNLQINYTYVVVLVTLHVFIYNENMIVWCTDIWMTDTLPSVLAAS